MNKMYGFEGEVNFKYNTLVYDLFSAVFNWLPLGYVLKKEGKRFEELTPHQFSSSTEAFSAMILRQSKLSKS